MLDEQNYKKRGWLKKLLLLVLASILIFLLVKTFYLNRPKLSPDKVAIFYLQAEQSSQRNLAEQFLFSDFEKVEILETKYKNLRLFNWLQKEETGSGPAFEVEEIKTEKNQVKVKILEKTNKKEGFVFFDYYLPKEIIFEAELTKLGNWREGYQWKITGLNSPDLILERKIGEKAEIRENIFIKPIKFEKVEYPTAQKIYSLEIEYENNSDNSITIFPFSSEWQIVEASGEVFSPPPSQTSSVFLREPILLGGELKPGETQGGYVMFETEKEISVKEIIFKNMEKKVIFEGI